MANPEDDVRQEGGPPDGRPRRQPPIIDVKAVEVSPDGPNPEAAGSNPDAGPTSTSGLAKRILGFLPSVKFAVIGSVCVIAVVAAGVLWVYLTLDGVGGSQRNAAVHEAAKSDDVIERVPKPETVLKEPPTQASADTDLPNRVAALEAMLTPLADRIVELERAVRDSAAAARIAGERADKVAGLLDEAKKSGAEQDSLQQHERGTLESIADRLKMLESEQIALHQKQEELDRAANATAAAPSKMVQAAIVAAALRSAVERDEPFTVELAAARSLGLDERALASLEPFAKGGVPTRNELLRGLSALLPELLRVPVPVSHDLGYLDRLQASAVKMLNIRPVGDEPGDDPATVIGRIEFKMAQQDIAGVVAELDRLPAPARELAQSWRTKVLARQGAIESARLIATASLAKLGEPAARGPSPQ
jgi:hypothetical protein